MRSIFSKESVTPLFLVIFFFFVASVSTQAMQLSQASTKPAISPDVMDSLLRTIDTKFFTAAQPIQIKKFLRAAFHDCMGGCDGSINLTNTENRGL